MPIWPSYGIVGQDKRIAPTVTTLASAGAVHGHVVGVPLARTAIPGNEQIAIGAFDDTGGMIVLRVQGEDQFGSMLGDRGVVCADKGQCD